VGCAHHSPYGRSHWRTSRQWHPATGKVAFTDHGWDLLAAKGGPIFNLDPPLEASLGLGALPTLMPFNPPNGKLIFDAGPLGGDGRWLSNR